MARKWIRACLKRTKHSNAVLLSFYFPLQRWQVVILYINVFKTSKQTTKRLNVLSRTKSGLETVRMTRRMKAKCISGVLLFNRLHAARWAVGARAATQTLGGVIAVSSQSQTRGPAEAHWPWTCQRGRSQRKSSTQPQQLAEVLTRC